MRKIMVTLLSATVLASMLSACAKQTETGTNGGTSTTPAATAAEKKENKKDVTIKMFNYKVEIVDALNKLVDEYKKETGVTIQVETHGGGEDYYALLKAELASGSEPELFNNFGFATLEPYLDRATDLSGEPWVKDLTEIAKKPTTVNGKLYGMPMNVEGYGIIYNKALFEKAGITGEPKTLPELKDAVAKLTAAGITPFIATNEWWSLGMHWTNVGLANQPDPVKFMSDLKAGQAKFKGNDVFRKYLSLADLIIANSQKDKTTTDYASQVSNFATGKGAMMIQGNWTQGDIDKIDKNLKLGVLPLPIDDQEGSIMIGVPSNYIVNSKSKHPEEAKAFLNWLVTSETGKKYITHEFKFIPALTTIKATSEDIGQIAVELQNKSGKAKGWYWDLFPDGVTQGLGAAMQEYLGGTVNQDQLLGKLDKAVEDIIKK
ncbi:ABC transporter substrate-binding protein [Paenibacillus hexagrammi]|uniref:ABC transporter substrate-binding protein n=1 Tax=Paenibacillus hexagrammi TaxID=2908839 RepID=A0ABY3SCX6_9BACL|nr:ABC transporter substrate-binding protein [Paenibacillus sp. YPD9-1]UJF31844.1 ABC transporter substrate-binding protein [Paenibacillus sp. YPD9-1]